METPKTAKPSQPNVFGLLGPYRLLVAVLLGLALLANATNLVIPMFIAHGIDAFSHGVFDVQIFTMQFLGIIAVIFCVSYGQSVMQVYASERVARDLRAKVAQKISRQTFAYVQTVTPSKLLTNLTSDVDAIKLFVSQAIVSIVSSIVLIFGASALLISINWKLALAVLIILPLIAFSFFTVFSRVGVLFKESQGIVDRLNKIINDSVLGASLIRVLNAQAREYDKFLDANANARDIGFKILRLFASVIPIIMFLSSLATVVVLSFGGHLVIWGQLSLGQLAAFNGYLSMLIFPIFIIGFMSNAIARANASYARVFEVLQMPESDVQGTRPAELTGKIEVENVSLVYGEKSVLQDVSFTIAPGTRNAIIGPTAAGKTQLLHVLTGLTAPNSGTIRYDGISISDYEKTSFHKQVSFVFQDSVLFNASIRENIAFSEDVSPENVARAIETAELHDFVDTLPEKLETIVSERGMSLSGGQKQRVMLARALALNPKILFLDDFTARVDTKTEKRILENVQKNYPSLTLISVTQKVAPVTDYDQIIVLMESEVLAKGTHAKLMESSPEYVQIAESQRTTNEYGTHEE